MSYPNQHHQSGPNSAPRKSRLTRFVAIALLLLFMPVLVFGATVAATGTVTVSVQEKDGVNLWIPVPALLFDIAVFAAPSFMPEDAMDEVREQVAPFREALGAMASELENIPAGSVLVEVQSDREQVRITKDWRSFEIAVDSDDANIRISVPARLLSRSLDIID